MSVLDTSVSFYRKTVKRLRPAHKAVHWLVTGSVIPVMERMKSFYTMPDDPLWFRVELLTNRHEIETTRVIDGLVKPGMTVLDIGAHVGYYARRCSVLAGDSGKIYAFEPHPRTYQTLMRNLKKTSNVTALQAAVAEEEGTAELYDYLMMSASGSLHYDESLENLQKSHIAESDIAPRIGKDFEMQKFTVRTVKIDDYLAELGVTQVDVIKMDIEGAEIGALRGMKQTIANSPNLALVMEYNPAALKAFEHEPQSAFKEVMDMGFTRVRAIHEDGTIKDITNDNATLNSMTEALMKEMGVVNLLFTKTTA